MTKPRTLYWDIETAPILAWVWSRWQDGVTGVEADWYALCISWRWEGESKSSVKSLDDFPGYDPLAPNDRHLVEFAHNLLSSADIAIAHNGNKFDTKKMNARFAFHGLGPCAPYLSVDTLTVARSNFMFSSNKLGDLGEHLGLGAKVPTGGFGLWTGVMAGEVDSWKQMKKYAKQDTDLLRLVYHALLPWAKTHPNLAVLSGVDGCPTCGSTDISKNGFTYTKVNRFQRWKCKDCGHFFRSRKSDPSFDKPEFTH